MILTVHDELVFECPKEEADGCGARARADGKRGLTGSAAHGRCGNRGELARRETVTANRRLLATAP